MSDRPKRLLDPVSEEALLAALNQGRDRRAEAISETGRGADRPELRQPSRVLRLWDRLVGVLRGLRS